MRLLEGLAQRRHGSEGCKPSEGSEGGGTYAGLKEKDSEGTGVQQR